MDCPAANYCQLVALISMYLVSSVAGGLNCWLCIADDCNQPPDSNYKASTKTCSQAASCQKVEYYGRDMESMESYTSVIRSCSQDTCVPHTDNCTDKLLANPGCMVRHCCDDGDLCNGSIRIVSSIIFFWVFPIVAFIKLNASS